MQVKKAIIYDFDKTIYSKETSITFMKYFLKKHPYLIFPFFINLIKILFNLFNLSKVKNIFFDIFKYNNPNEDIIDFWEKEINNIYPYFFNEISNNKKEADILILISASPDFLLKPLYKKLGFDILIATEYNNYSIVGKNCKGVEKLNRLNNLGAFHVLAFYSDSLSDKPLFDIADKKFSIVKGKKNIGLPKKNGLIDKWL